MNLRKRKNEVLKKKKEIEEENEQKKSELKNMRKRNEDMNLIIKIQFFKLY